MRIDALALTFTSITLVGGAALRGAGDTRTPMVILGGVNVLNAISSFALVYGWGPLPAMGVTGIVLGTVDLTLVMVEGKPGKPREIVPLLTEAAERVRVLKRDTLLASGK